MSSLKCRLCEESLIGPILRQEASMRNILEDFMEFGHLQFDQLIDELIARGVLEPEHHELLTIHSERRHVARQLWMLLLHVPPRKFREHVQPVLQSLGLWKEESSFEAKTEMCLRCVMEFMLPVELLADKLVTEGFLKVAEYRDAVRSRMFEFSKWELLFDCLRRERGKGGVLVICRQMLEEFEIPIPPDLSRILQQGLPCACSETDRRTAVRGALSGPPTGLLCNICAAFAKKPHLQSQDRPEPHVEQDDDTDDDVELRPRSCRNIRTQRMAQTHRFQKDVMKTMTPAKRISG